MDESLEDLQRQVKELTDERDAYVNALHALVNAVTTARQAVDAHLLGTVAVDWVWLKSILEGRADIAGNAIHSPERQARLARQAVWHKDQDRVGSAVLEMYSTLVILDAIIEHPEAAKTLGPFDQNIRRAVKEFQEIRGLLAWMIYSNVKTGGVETPPNAPRRNA